MPSFRTMNFDKENNEAELRFNLDLLVEKKGVCRGAASFLQAPGRQVL